MFKIGVFLSTTSDFAKRESQDEKVDWANKLYERLLKDYNPYLYSECDEAGIPEKIIQKRITESHIFIGIYGSKPGSKNKNDKYIIHWEYKLAEENGKTIKPLIMNPRAISEDKSHELFLETISSFNKNWITEFSDENSLITKCEEILNKLGRDVYSYLLWRYTKSARILCFCLPFFMILATIMTMINFFNLPLVHGNIFSELSDNLLYMIFWFFVLVCCLIMHMNLQVKPFPDSHGK